MEKTDESAPLTFHFAPEIEQALVSLCFYAPERIAVLKRELDVEVHFTRPELRYILEAIQLAYCELGTSDFASVIVVLRELGRLEDCGGIGEVNTIFGQYRYGFSCPQAEEEIFAHYLAMLKAYALAREQTPGGPPIYHFAGGKGTTVPNKVKRYPNDPDETGQAMVAGKRYSVKLWRTPEFTNLRFSPTT
jgi:hypothetical protein